MITYTGSWLWQAWNTSIAEINKGNAVTSLHGVFYRLVPLSSISGMSTRYLWSTGLGFFPRRKWAHSRDKMHVCTSRSFQHRLKLCLWSTLDSSTGCNRSPVVAVFPGFKGQLWINKATMVIFFTSSHWSLSLWMWATARSASCNFQSSFSEQQQSFDCWYIDLNKE